MPRITAKDLDVAFDEAKNETPRGAAIVLYTILESALEDGICARLLPNPMSNTQRDTLFGGEAGFGSFASKVDLGYSLGLYGPQTRSDLHLIRKIRNQFAHYSPRSFSHPDVTEHCKKLTYYGKADLVMAVPEGATPKMIEDVETFNMRWRFIHCVHHIGSEIYAEVKNEYHPPLPTVLP